jgi:hypothetical protein
MTVHNGHLRLDQTLYDTRCETKLLARWQGTSVCHSPGPVAVQFAEIQARQGNSGREGKGDKPQETKADQV